MQLASLAECVYFGANARRSVFPLRFARPHRYGCLRGHHVVHRPKNLTRGDVEGFKTSACPAASSREYNREMNSAGHGLAYSYVFAQPLLCALHIELAARCRAVSTLQLQVNADGGMCCTSGIGPSWYRRAHVLDKKRVRLQDSDECPELHDLTENTPVS